MTTSSPELVPILMYHSVADTAHAVDAPFTVRPADFRRHVDALADWGAHTLTVRDYAAGLRAGRAFAPRTVVITIDDGYADTGEVVGPVLADAGMTASVMVTTAVVGAQVRDSRMISWAQVAELRRQGFEIAAHGHTHVPLDTVPRAAARTELRASREALEDHLGEPVTTMAYPHGYYHRRLMRLAREEGYLAACAARNGLSHPGDDPYALSRVVVGAATDPGALLDLVEGRTVGPAIANRTLPRAAWRGARWLGSRAGVGSAKLPSGAAPATRARAFG